MLYERKNFLVGISILVGRLLKIDEISVIDVPMSSSNRLRRDQMRGAIEQARALTAGNTVFAPVLAYQAWHTSNHAIVILWTVAMLIFSWWAVLGWNKLYHTKGSEEDMRGFVRGTCLNAALWCSGMVLFYPMVSGNEKIILTIVMTGSLALGTVGFSLAPKAAFCYLGIQTMTLTLVPFVCGIYRDSNTDLAIAGLALLAGGAIFNSVLERARSQMKAFHDQESLLQKNEMIDLLLKDYEEQGTEWVWKTDANGKIVICPQYIKDLISNPQYSQPEIVMLDALKTHIEDVGMDDFENVSNAFSARQEFHNVTLPLFSQSKGKLQWIMMRGRPQFDGEEFSGFRGIFADATKNIEAQKQITLLAENDPLTGTFNRNYVQNYLEDLDPKEDQAMAYLIDLDGFKQVNDSYGHSIGDRLLEQVAKRLNQCLGETGMVARLGGDEFLIITDQEGFFAGLDRQGLSLRLLSRLSEPYLIDQYDISLSASIGTANFPSDTEKGSVLLNLADLALYVAKKSGRNKCVAFVPSMQEGLQKRLIVTDRLRQAVNRDDIVPYYQPQYCSKTLNLVGFEALARWTDAELGVVGPDIFIPIAEETGLIHEIGEAILLKSCYDALSWNSCTSEKPLTVSVNVSAVQVMRGDVVKTVKSVLKKTGLPPQQLEIEITESVLIDNLAGTKDTLIALSRLGVSIALDDFGTGYSSLSYLRALPLNRVKIDRSFVSDIDDIEAQMVIQTIIDLCSRLNLDIVAEGVESIQNVEKLTKMNCPILQGYYFARPLPADAIEDLLNNHTHQLEQCRA